MRWSFDQTKLLNSTIVNRALPSLHEGSLKIYKCKCACTPAVWFSPGPILTDSTPYCTHCTWSLFWSDPSLICHKYYFYRLLLLNISYKLDLKKIFFISNFFIKKEKETRSRFMWIWIKLHESLKSFVFINITPHNKDLIRRTRSFWISKF